MTSINYSKVISDIYDASIKPKQWNQCAKSIAQYVDGDTANLFFMDTEQTSNNLIGSYNIDMEVFYKQYTNHYIQLDPWNEPLIRLPSRIIYDANTLGVDMRQIIKTEYYNDFWSKAGLHHTSGACLDLDYAVCVFGVHRHKDKNPFSTNDLAKLQTLIPHIERSITLYKDYLESKNQTENISELFLCANVGVIAIGRKNKILETNEIAEKVLSREDGLIVKDRQLSAIANKEDLVLQKSLQHSPFLQNNPVQIYISRTNSISSYALNIIPAINKYDVISINPANAAFYIFIIDPDHTPNYTLDNFTHYYQLTKAEAVILEKLIQGLSVSSISEQAHVSKDTVRAHIKSCFQKTLTHSQSELVAKALKESLAI